MLGKAMKSNYVEQLAAMGIVVIISVDVEVAQNRNS